MTTVFGPGKPSAVDDKIRFGGDTAVQEAGGIISDTYVIVGIITLAGKFSLDALIDEFVCDIYERT